MENPNRVCKLNIIEPWEFGTEKAIDASIIGKNNNEYLIFLTNPLLIKGMMINHLLGEIRDKEKPVDLLSQGAKGTIAMNLVYSDKINEQNFKSFSIKDFRGNFLLGEVIL